MTNSEILTEILDSYEKSNDAFKRSKVDGDMQILEVIFKAMNRVKNNVDLADVGGSLLTCTLLEREDVMFGKYKLTSCCKQGPVTQENYCPNCGAKIERQ